MKKKPTLAVLFGGNSPEYSVSLQSAYAVLTNLDGEKYHILPLGITQTGRWYLYSGAYEHIATDTWAEALDHLTPVAVSPDPAVHGLLALFPHENRVIPLDCALPILHGANGEDGTVQGLFQLAGIPVAGCGTLASALCMDKDRAHKLAKLAGVAVPRSLVLQAWEDPQRAADFAQQTGYPLFVKPVNAGSSFGISQIHRPEELRPALDLALEYDTQVILEEAIPGRGGNQQIMGTQELVVGEIDEIELSQGFFNFTQKCLKLPHHRPRPGVSRHRPASEGDRQGDLPGPGLHRLCPGGTAHPRGADCVQRGQHHPRLYGVQPVPRHDEGRRLLLPEILDTILGQVMAP